MNDQVACAIDPVAAVTGKPPLHERPPLSADQARQMVGLFELLANESRLRMLIVLAGLPEPKVNHKLLDERGRVRRRLDLSYPDLRLIVRDRRMRPSLAIA